MKKNNFILDKKRVETMRNRLGKAVDLIDGEQFLGVFRNRQINFEKEFEASVKMVKNMKKSGKIKNAKRYFAKIWSKENLSKTLEIIHTFINRQIARLAEQREQHKRQKYEFSVRKSQNADGLRRLKILKQEYNLS